ncbi:hypothetical protein P7D22_00010 [Lichenihabitans sp. Uapishka_5]|uniref:hypothetical protein n=1 Tax=Lichenihabitans sp. Uapishka_5 TaxID=3037302 RepID=UPI0029E7D7AD|nr:hypothetical protein [Lichenihabitans sp. Uapishka_5]MDX7949563.1 hypothetical protein [Lichenihabitans sp. Uapishka_5]
MFEAPVAVPSFGQAVPPPVDTSWIAQLPQTYRQGVLQQRQLDIANAGQDTTPAGASAPDMTALTNRLMQLGAYDQAGTLMSLGLRQKVLNSPGSLDDPLGRGGAGPQASAAGGTSSPFNPANSTKGANPEVVAYVKQAAQQRDMNPNVALAVSGGEGLKGFDPNGSANPGDGNSSFGPFQLHYGNVAGSGAGNQVAGLGDDFTKATGLDARDPSTWKAQVDFALDHAAKNGWGAFHGARALGIGNFAGIGGRPSTVAAYAPQPAAAPAQAAIGAATGQQPYRVASLGPVAPPAGSPPASAPTANPQPPGFGAANGSPTAGTAQSQMVTPAEWAAKFNPNDPGLAGKIADAIGIDPGESIDVQDLNIRRAVLPVLQASRQQPTSQPGASPSATAAATTAEPVPGNSHPFGPGGSAGAPPRPPVGSVNPVAADPAAAPMPTQASALGRFVAQPGPQLTPAVPQPVQPQAGADVPGLPAGYQQPGGGTRYINDVLGMASQYADAGLEGRAKAYTVRAQQVQAQLEAAQKSQLDLQTHNAELTPEQKNFGTMRDQYGFTGSPLDLENQQAQQKADARARASAQYGLIETQQPDGTTIYVPRAQVLNGTAGGGSNGPVVKSQPAYVTQGQSALLSKLNDGATSFQERQVAGERLDALGNLLSTFQTGANSDAFNNAAANLRSFGIDVPDTATTNPAAMQTFAKNAYASVLSAMREQGNKQFVAEVQSAINSNPNPNLQPAANQAMIAQIKGIQSYRDQNYRDYSDWYDGNKGASNDAKFQTDWAKANPLSRYVGDAKKEIAPLGVAIPPADQRVTGQRYAVPGQGVFRWQGNGWSKN